MIYEATRSWVSEELEISPLDLVIVGSGSIGFSLKPHPELGRRFDERLDKTPSDLDFAVLDPGWFATVQNEFESWSRDYESGLVNPRSDRERQLWDSNRATVVRNLPAGVLDPGKIPTWSRYPRARSLLDIQFRLGERLVRSSLDRRKLSFRLFDGVDSFLTRQLANLRAVLR
jgi:hypothetical protein